MMAFNYYEVLGTEYGEAVFNHVAKLIVSRLPITERDAVLNYHKYVNSITSLQPEVVSTATALELGVITQQEYDHWMRDDTDHVVSRSRLQFLQDIRQGSFIPELRMGINTEKSTLFTNKLACLMRKSFHNNFKEIIDELINDYEHDSIFAILEMPYLRMTDEEYDWCNKKIKLPINEERINSDRGLPSHAFTAQSRNMASVNYIDTPCSPLAYVNALNSFKREFLTGQFEWGRHNGLQSELNCLTGEMDITQR